MWKIIFYSVVWGRKKSHTLCPVTGAAPATTEAPSVIRTRLGAEGGCGEEVARDILWVASAPATTQSRPCPPATLGVAVRECLGRGRGWGAPQLGNIFVLNTSDIRKNPVPNVNNIHLY